MKNNIFASLTFCFVSVLMLAQQNEDTETLKEVYHQFEDNLKKKEISKLETIFINSNVPLNTVIRMPDSLVVLSNPLSNWVGFLRKAKLPYELRISNTKYVIDNDVAYSIADFNEYVDNKHQSKGIDLFFYLKTKNKWRLAALHGTATLISKPDAKGVENLTEKSVNDVIKKLLSILESKTAIPTLNNSNKNTSFIAEVSTLTYNRGEDSDWITTNIFEFINERLKKVRGNFHFKEANIQLIDRHMAVVKTPYELRNEQNEIAFSGNVYIGVLASNMDHPRITCVFFSN